jgi:hypothetical protein
LNQVFAGFFGVAIGAKNRRKLDIAFLARHSGRLLGNNSFFGHLELFPSPQWRDKPLCPPALRHISRGLIKIGPGPILYHLDNLIKEVVLSFAIKKKCIKAI